MPTASRYKIFIIDEVHMLTTEAFNALLKTLEEPPDHVYFMFATTELHRVPVTILSRCQRYELKRVSHGELAEHFKRLAEQENISIAKSALNLIVREAGGSVRDGLSLLDQVFSYCGENVSEEEVVDVLGLVSHDVVADLADSLLNGDLAGALARLDAVYDYGMDLKRFINDFLDWFRALVVCKVSAEPNKLLDMAEDELAALTQTAANYSEETLSFMFHTLFESLEKVSFATRPRFAFEMAFIHAVQVRDVVPADEIIHKLDALLAGAPLPEKKKSPVRPLIEKKLATEPLVASDVHNDGSASGSGGGENSELGAPPRNDKPLEAETEKPTVKRDPEEFVGGVKTGQVAGQQGQKKDVRKHWNGFVDYVRDRKPWMASALARAASIRLEQDELTLDYTNSVDCRLLRNRENVKPLTEFALDFFQENFRIRFESPDAANDANDSKDGLSPQQERQDLANDPLVLAALDVFSGQVGDIRVGPRFRKEITKNDSNQGEANGDEAG